MKLLRCSLGWAIHSDNTSLNVTRFSMCVIGLLDGVAPHKIVGYTVAYLPDGQ